MSKAAANTVHVKYRKIHNADLVYDDKVKTHQLSKALQTLTVPSFCVVVVSGERDVRRRA